MINRLDGNGESIDVAESNGNRKHTIHSELDYIYNTIDKIIKSLESDLRITTLKDLQKDIENMRCSVNLYDKTMEYVKDINDIPTENLSLISQRMSTQGGDKLDILNKKGAVLDLENDNTTSVFAKTNKIAKNIINQNTGRTIKINKKSKKSAKKSKKN